MDERVLGDVPSEGSEGGRRFGIYRSNSPDPKMHSISKLRLVFVFAIAAIVTFAVFFPMIQYASRANQKSVHPQYPSLTNRTSVDGKPSSAVNNCSATIFAFGYDCKETLAKSSINESFASTVDIAILEVKNVDNTSNSQIEDDSSETRKNISDMKGTTFQRKGRSRWPPVSTPYPYYNLAIPTPTVNEDKIDYNKQTNIFAIPSDFSTDNVPDTSSPRINFTPPPYAFTPYPNFTDSYAQLSPYKVSNNNTNIEEVLRYLKRNGAPNNNVLHEKSENVLLGGTTTMRVSGTYIMPFDRRRPGEIILSSSEEDDDGSPYYNGHAYVTDPFLKFRPSNPLEINRLIPIRSGLDIGPRFRKPISFVPTSSIGVDITPPFQPPEVDLQDAGSHTVAIFHPPGPGVVRPPPLQRPTTVPTREKPLSVTLDIYPVTIEADSGISNAPPTPPGRERGRWRPKPTERPRWRPQAPRRPAAISDKPPSDNHMVVHLNLFPNKRKPYSFLRRSREESSTQPYTKTTVKSDGQSLALTSEGSRKSTPTILPLIPTGGQNATDESQPGFAALAGTVEEPTTSAVSYSDDDSLGSNDTTVDSTTEQFVNNILDRDRMNGTSLSLGADGNVAETTTDMFNGLGSTGDDEFVTSESSLREQPESTTVSITN